MNDLSNEIIDYILQFIPEGEELKNTRLVCSLWNKFYIRKNPEINIKLNNICDYKHAFFPTIIINDKYYYCDNGQIRNIETGISLNEGYHIKYYRNIDNKIFAYSTKNNEAYLIIISENIDIIILRNEYKYISFTMDNDELVLYVKKNKEYFIIDLNFRILSKIHTFRNYNITFIDKYHYIFDEYNLHCFVDENNIFNLNIAEECFYSRENILILKNPYKKILYFLNLRGDLLCKKTFPNSKSIGIVSDKRQIYEITKNDKIIFHDY